jgi:glycyl-tRNA synthetase
MSLRLQKSAAGSSVSHRPIAIIEGGARSGQYLFLTDPFAKTEADPESASESEADSASDASVSGSASASASDEEVAREVRKELQKVHPSIAWDDNGNIGKRYRRRDEIGTPFCITIDFDTLGETPELKDTVTLRHRDSGEQERIPVADLAEKIRAAIA